MEQETKMILTEKDDIPLDDLLNKGFMPLYTSPINTVIVEDNSDDNIPDLIYPDIVSKTEVEQDKIIETRDSSTICVSNSESSEGQTSIENVIMYQLEVLEQTILKDNGLNNYIEKLESLIHKLKPYNIKCELCTEEIIGVHF